jgi:hypothetical protein
MKKLIIIFFIGFCNTTFGQLNNIEITFEITNSLKMPYSYEEIKLFQIDNENKISVKTRSFSKDFKLGKSRIDTIYPITKNQYDSIVLMIKQLPTHKITEEILNLGTGVEGTTCKLEYGNWQNRISIKVWSPDYETEKRNLVEFLAICRKILVYAKFEPDRI